MRRFLAMTLLLLVLVSGGNALAFYNPSTGRWLSRDPIGERSEENVFCFCGNRPVGSADKLGLARARFERTTYTGNLKCHEVCICEPTEFYKPPDLKPVPVQPGQPINLEDWIYFRLFYPEWTDDGCSCVYYGWKGDELLQSKSKGPYGRICIECEPPPPPPILPDPVGTG